MSGTVINIIFTGTPLSQLQACSTGQQENTTIMPVFTGWWRQWRGRKEIKVTLFDETGWKCQQEMLGYPCKSNTKSELTLLLLPHFSGHRYSVHGLRPLHSPVEDKLQNFWLFIFCNISRRISKTECSTWKDNTKEIEQYKVQTLYNYASFE